MYQKSSSSSLVLVENSNCSLHMKQLFIKRVEQIFSHKSLFVPTSFHVLFTGMHEEINVDAGRNRKTKKSSSSERNCVGNIFFGDYNGNYCVNCCFIATE